MRLGLKAHIAEAVGGVAVMGLAWWLLPGAWAFLVWVVCVIFVVGGVLGAVNDIGRRHETLHRGIVGRPSDGDLDRRR